VQYASLLPHIRINAAAPGLTATDLIGGQGHSVHDGTDAIIAHTPVAAAAQRHLADRDGTVPW
jgi:hypothetical protein